MRRIGRDILGSKRKNKIKIKTLSEEEKEELLEHLKAERAEDEQEQKRTKFPNEIRYRFNNNDHEAKPEENPTTEFLLLAEGQPVEIRKRAKQS